VPRLGIRDVIAPGLRVLFVGINPGMRSGQLGHHFAGKGNPFWRLLHTSGLIDRPLTFLEDRQLLAYRMGITNVASRTTRTAAELTREELASGVRALERKVRRFRPELVAFVGLSIYRDIYGRGGSPGAGEKTERFAGARIFVLPNPSGRNAAFPGFQHKLVWYEALRRFVEKL
jgi:TDG/mug DNA glycosylase family protein